MRILLAWLVITLSAINLFSTDYPDAEVSLSIDEIQKLKEMEEWFTALKESAKKDSRVIQFFIMLDGLINQNCGKDLNQLINTERYNFEEQTHCSTFLQQLIKTMDQVRAHSNTIPTFGVYVTENGAVDTRSFRIYYPDKSELD